MKRVSKILVGALLALGITACSTTCPTTPNIAKMNKGQNIQIFSVDNSKGIITAKSVEEAFSKSGLNVDGNNNMNLPFQKRYNHIHHKIYNLAMFKNSELVLKLLKKYPSAGLIAPMSMSIYSDDAKGTINISTLSIDGMARITQIPVNDPDLVAYAKIVNNALYKALPNGKFKPLPYTVKHPDKALVTDFEAEFEADDSGSYATAKEDFEAELEGELESLGFLFPNYNNFKEDLFDPAKYDAYDFYDTYSICKFNVIYPVSKNHPEVGAYAPCTFYIYKKKDEEKVHVGFPSVDNWINTTDITDKESIEPLRKAQGMLEKILKDLTEE